MLKRIIYFGRDLDFLKELNQYISRKGLDEFSIQDLDYTPGSITKLCSDNFQHIVFVDISFIDHINALMCELLYLKKNSKFKKTVFAATLSNQAYLFEQKYLLTVGFQLFYVKGAESESLFRDAFYLSFEEISDFPIYAKARNINKNLVAGACSTLNSLSETVILLETDLDIIEDAVNLSLPVFPNLSCKTFNIKDRNTFLPHFDMLNSYVLDLPISGPWDEDPSASLQQDTLDTWKDLNLELKTTEPINIKIFSKNHNLAYELFSFYDSSKIRITFHDEVSVEDLSEELSRHAYPLIFYDFVIEPDGDENLEKLQGIISSVSEAKSIIISTRNPSNTQAMQKVLNYSNILCDSKELKVSLFTALVQNYLQKKMSDQNQGYYFPVQSTQRNVDIKFEVQITSLSEHEITFYSTTSLPMYGLLHFTLPVEFIATIVPSLYILPNRSESQHYMAFINGVDEKEIEILRKFVNQIIYKPLLDYTQETISTVLNYLKMDNIKQEELIQLESVPVIKEKARIVVKKIAQDTMFKGKFKRQGKNK